MPWRMGVTWVGSMDLHGPEISRICSSSEISRFWCAGARFGKKFAHLPSENMTRHVFAARAALRARRHLDRYRLLTVTLHTGRYTTCGRKHVRHIHPPPTANTLRCQFTYHHVHQTVVTHLAHSPCSRKQVPPFFAHISGFRAFDIARKFRSVNTVSRICSENRRISLTTHPCRHAPNCALMIENDE